QDLELIIQATKVPSEFPDFIRSVLIPMHDSSGKKGSGILKGHYYFAGHYSECASIDYKVEGRDRPFRGAYFKIGIDLLFRPNSHNDSC
ncbi:hypothetical protein PENTCL1PPCAC_15948, partial [Pristionchus entomophagus]